MQHLIREGLPIALIFAGIPQAVSDLLNDKVSTFLRRADPIDLADVALPAVAAAFIETFRDTELEISDDLALQAARATGGYPFLIQLVGYHIWRLARKDGAVTVDAVARGIDAARRRLGATVLEPVVADLSGVNRTFLLRMVETTAPPRAARMLPACVRGRASFSEATLRSRAALVSDLGSHFFQHRVACGVQLGARRERRWTAPQRQARSLAAYRLRGIGDPAPEP